MKTIMRIEFGSRLYGTSTPASDFDFKSVFLPDARDILLQNGSDVVEIGSGKVRGTKTEAGATEETAYSLKRYLSMLAESSPVAVDMLFAPIGSHTTAPDWIWTHIFDERHRIISRKATYFLKYCRDQANKYGIKGSRVAAARKALEILETALSTNDIQPHDKLEKVVAPLEGEIALAPFMSVISIPMPSGGEVKHWEVCNRKMPYTSSVKNAYDVMARLVAEYGHRALQAEKNEGVDWKALSHAVRVGMQAVELFQTGEIRFPLAYADHLVQIKTGKISYQVVADTIERLLPLVEAAAAASSLPEEPDLQWIDDFVADTYRDVVLEEWRKV